MNVLSLFDGMSCGMLALERAGIEVENYFASEIDKYAIKVSKANYPNIKHVGSVVNVKSENLPEIDLLIGGSPCQGFSIAGKHLNFEDPRSKLFFEYVRLLKECKPKYFLLENVVMKKEFQDVISKELGVNPILINSALVSAQNRKRLYWTNIPNVEQPKDRNLLLRDILDREIQVENFRTDLELKDFNSSSICHHAANATNVKGSESIKRIYADSGKSPTLTTMGGGNREPKVLTNGVYWRKLTPIECERLQTVPENYTNFVSNSQRYKMLGNGWTIDVISHVFKSLKKESGK